MFPLETDDSLPPADWREAIDDDVILAQRAEDWAELQRALDADWRL